MNQIGINQFAQTAAQFPPGFTPEPQPTDMQTHVQRAQEVNARLNNIHSSLVDLIGRLYGEGVTACGESKATPRAAGLSSELTESLSHIEGVADRLDQAVTRLSQFA